MDSTIALEQFIAKHTIKLTCQPIAKRPDGLMDGGYLEYNIGFTLVKDRMQHYHCRIYKGGVHPTLYPSFGLYFSQGSAHTSAPTLAEVLDCLASDASGYENAKPVKGLPRDMQIFENWASEYGYDTDSRKAEKTFKVIKRQAEQLKRTLGVEAYKELLWNFVPLTRFDVVRRMRFQWR